MLNQAQVLLKRSCTFGKLVNIQITGVTLLCTGKNNICISCVFNGFKYIMYLKTLWKIEHLLPRNFHNFFKSIKL